MCFDSDATPPAAGPPISAVDSADLRLRSADGADFDAFRAQPRQPACGGVVVLPDARGLAPFYRKLAVRLAEQGHPTIAIDYFGRSAGENSDRGEGFPWVEHIARLDRTRMHDDMVAAIDELRLACHCVFALGFCMGGRTAFMASAARFGLAGVIGFYGMPGIGGPYGPGPTQHAAELAAPILGLFGGADEGITPALVDAFDAALTAAGVAHDLVTYPGAPHSFFDRRDDEFAEACADAWRRVLAFLAQVGEPPMAVNGQVAAT